MTIQMKFILVFFTIITFSLINGCGIWDPAAARKVSPNADERVRKNLEEGRGITLMGGIKGGKTSYQFASSNPMWRASLEILDFSFLKSPNSLEYTKLSLTISLPI